jgi:hypothetical protein
MKNIDNRPIWQSEQKDKFRMAVKDLLLVYNNCPTDWTKEFILEKLHDQVLTHNYGKKRFKSRIKSWIISRKNYEDNIQFYCLFALDEIVEIKKQYHLDIENVHHTYIPVKDVMETLEYVKSQGEWAGKGFPGIQSTSEK